MISSAFQLQDVTFCMRIPFNPRAIRVGVRRRRKHAERTTRPRMFRLFIPSKLQSSSLSRHLVSLFIGLDIVLLTLRTVFLVFFSLEQTTRSYLRTSHWCAFLSLSHLHVASLSFSRVFVEPNLSSSYPSCGARRCSGSRSMGVDPVRYRSTALHPMPCSALSFRVFPPVPLW